MGILDSFFGGGGSDPSALYPGLLSPQQSQALAQRGLLGFLGGMQKSGALDYTAPFLSGKVPAGFAAGLAGGAAGMGEAQDAAVNNAMRAQLVGLEGQRLHSQLDMMAHLYPMIGQYLSGGEAGNAPSPANPAGGEPQSQSLASGPPQGSAPGSLSVAQIKQLALDTGFKGDAADKATAIVMAESGGNPNAVGDGGTSFGLSQINAPSWGPVAASAKGNPQQAMKLMFDISNGGSDFKPWSTFKNGAYQKFMGAASATQPIGANYQPGMATAALGGSQAPPEAPASAGADEPPMATGNYTPAQLAAAKARGMIGQGGLPLVPPQAFNVNSKGMPYAPDLATGAGNINPAVFRGFEQANANPAPGLLAQNAPQAPAAPSGGLLAQGAPQGVPAPMPQQAPSPAPPIAPPGMAAGGASNFNARAPIALGILGQFAGMPGLGQLLESDPRFQAEVARQKAWAGVPAEIYTKMNTPAELRTNGLGYIPSTGQILARNPAVAMGQTIGGTALNPVAENIPGALQGIANEQRAKDLGKYQAEFGGLPGTGLGVAPAPAPASAPSSEPIPTPRGTQLPPISEQFMPQSPKELADAIPAWQKKTDEWNAGIAPARQAEMRLSTIADAFKLTESGAFETHKAELGMMLKAMGIDPALAMQTNPAAVQEALHDNILTTLPLLKAATPRPSQIEFMSVSENREHPNLAPAANLRMLSEDIALVRQAQQLPADWNMAQQQGWRNPQSFETAWSNLNPLDKARTQAVNDIGPLKGMPGFTPPSDKAIQFLQMNPKYRGDFDAKYGAGAAAKVLGQ